MKTFLEQTAQSIVEHIEWNKLSNTTLVLPSHRAGLVLKNELMRLQREQGHQAVWSPQVMTLTQLQNALSPLYAEDELFTIVRLYRHYRQLNAGDNDLMPLDMFYGWGRQMLSDFTNVDASMPAEQVPKFFENAIAANDLDNLQLEQDVRDRLTSLIRQGAQHADDSIFRRYEVIWKQLYMLYAALHDELEAEHKGYAGMRQRAVIEHWDTDAVQKKIAGRMYVFVGFNYLLPVERELMEKLKAAGQAMFYWDFVPNFQTNTKAFHFAELNSRLLGSANDSRPTTNDKRQTTIVACPSRESQAQYVHRWLQENYTAHGQKVGVVICDESMLESVIYTIPAIMLPGETEPEPVNITKGFPLRNTQIFSRVLAWLYDKRRGDVEQVVNAGLIDQILNDLGLTATDDRPTTNWKDLLILESEYQVRKIANQMRLLVSTGIGDMPITLKLLRLLMRRTMEDVTMPFHGEPITDIQIMGVLETRMMDFDKLLILHADEGVIPQHQADNSFIPYYLRKAYSMQTPDEKATIYAYNFFRLLSRAGQSTLLYTTIDGAENSKGMSRFIMQMLVSPEFDVQKRVLHEPNILPEFDETILGTSGKSMFSLLEKGADGMLRRKGKDYPYSLSPSAMNTYIDCPRMFCLQYIQGYNGEEKTEAQFSPAELGTFVHAAMEYLYREYILGDKEAPVCVRPEQLAAISDRAHLDEALQKAYEKVNEEWLEEHDEEPNHYQPSQHLSENEMIIRFTLNILERDMADAALGLQICLLEAPRYFDLNVPDIGKIRMGGKIDRLDIYGPKGQEKLRVVDYKSGGYKSEKVSATKDNWMTHPDKKYVRQTLVYSHAVMANEEGKQPIEPNLYFCSHKLTNLSTTVKVDKTDVLNYRDIQDDFLKALRAKVAEILTAKEFPPCPENKCKSYCPFLGLCHRTVREQD